MHRLEISNRQARRLWLASQGLSGTPTGPLDVLGMIHKLGFVQIDTIQVVARCQHHILWSRNQNYREKMLNPLLARDRAIFEHFTHDASVLPMDMLPLWRRQFRRIQAKMDRAGWWGMTPPGPIRAEIRARIEREGALCSQDFETDAPRSAEMWARPPHKKALDYMWYGGELATCFRKNFNKYYNLAERVFPDALWRQDMEDHAQVDGLHQAAMDRIWFGTLGEVRKFWDATEVAETKDWAARAKLVPVRIGAADGGWYEAVALPDIEARLADLEAPTSRLRILNPFDPAIRDRNRLERLFGMEYRNEMFVPAAKRIWGYYVFPLLEGDRFVGRLEAKAHRAKDKLEVINLWPEAGVKWTAGRQRKLEAELERLARFVGVGTITEAQGRTVANL